MFDEEDDDIKSRNLGTVMGTLASGAPANQGGYQRPQTTKTVINASGLLSGRSRVKRGGTRRSCGRPTLPPSGHPPVGPGHPTPLYLAPSTPENMASNVRLVAVTAAEAAPGKLFFSTAEKRLVRWKGQQLRSVSTAELSNLACAHKWVTGPLRFPTSVYTRVPNAEELQGVLANAESLLPHVEHATLGGALLPSLQLAEKPGYYADAKHLVLAARSRRPAAAPRIPLREYIDAVPLAAGNSRLGPMAVIVQYFSRHAIQGPVPLYRCSQQGGYESCFREKLLACLAPVASRARHGWIAQDQLPSGLARRLALGDSLPNQMVFGGHEPMGGREEVELAHLIGAREPVLIRQPRGADGADLDPPAWIEASPRHATIVLSGLGALTGPMANKHIHIEQAGEIGKPWPSPFRTPGWSPDLFLGFADICREWHGRGCPAPSVIHPVFPEWSRIVGGLLGVACDLLGYGSAEESGRQQVDRWLHALVNKPSSADKQLLLLFTWWPAGPDGCRLALSREQVLDLVEAYQLPSLVSAAGPGDRPQRMSTLARHLEGIAVEGRRVGPYRLFASPRSRSTSFVPVRVFDDL